MNIAAGNREQHPQPPPTERDHVDPPQETVERPPGRERPSDVPYNKQIDEYWKERGK
jgi:hypothetical protein